VASIETEVTFTGDDINAAIALGERDTGKGTVNTPGPNKWMQQTGGPATDGSRDVWPIRGRTQPAPSGGKQVRGRRDQLRPVVPDVAHCGADLVKRDLSYRR
jgi:hypothetical protein